MPRQPHMRSVLEDEMKDRLEIKWPWEMVWSEFVDEIIVQIKEALPPDHELQRHDLYPGIKWSKRPVFIVDDDTTGECLLVNFENRKRWKKTKYKAPTITIFNDRAEVAAMINRDHARECAKYNSDGSTK
jgi:hypothetical protein